MCKRQSFAQAVRQPRWNGDQNLKLSRHAEVFSRYINTNGQAILMVRLFRKIARALPPQRWLREVTCRRLTERAQR
jgi:hypothetical protein